MSLRPQIPTSIIVIIIHTQSFFRSPLFSCNVTYPFLWTAFSFIQEIILFPIFHAFGGWWLFCNMQRYSLNMELNHMELDLPTLKEISWKFQGCMWLSCKTCSRVRSRSCQKFYILETASYYENKTYRDNNNNRVASFSTQLSVFHLPVCNPLQSACIYPLLHVNWENPLNRNTGSFAEFDRKKGFLDIVLSR